MIRSVTGRVLSEPRPALPASVNQTFRYDFVIIGGGAGGLELAARLGRRMGPKQGPARVLLVDRNISHLWKPSLHEVAAGTLDASQESISYPLLARRNNFSFALGRFTGLDAKRRCISLSSSLDCDSFSQREIGYGHLVLAMGSGSNFFKTPGAQGYAHVLEDAEDARQFHARLTHLFLSAAYEGRQKVSIAIVGAGATGTELAAEIITGHSELARGLQPTNHFDMDVTLIEAGKRILDGLSGRIANNVLSELCRRGVTVKTHTRVEAVTAEGLQTTAGWVEADAVVWAAGVLASPDNLELGLETGPQNQILVDAHLRTSDPRIRAIGDCSRLQDDPIPPIAQAAAQQARYLADSLLNPQGDKPFQFRDRGALVSLGQSGAVGSLMGGVLGRGFIIEGLMARMAYAGIRFEHYLSVVGLRRTLFMSLARRFSKRAAGRLKLH
jgi:NADH dehydrogenase